jgi:polysaccharide biosynthesis/export protein
MGWCSMFARLVLVVSMAAILLSGCSALQRQAAMPHAGFGTTTIVVDAPLPIIQASGTAIAGWSSQVSHDESQEASALSPASFETNGPYRLDSGDKLRVFVYAQPSLSRIYTIDNEGFISVPLIGNVQARGSTTRGLEHTIKARLGAEFVRDPHVTVDIQQHRPFFILGEVKTAGQYPYVGGLTVEGAVAIAGGYSERANERKVHITRRIKGGIEKFEVAGDAEIRPGDTIHVKERWF